MIKILEKDSEKAVVASDMEIQLANAIRRSVNEIPILAIDEVDIHKNDSALYDQILAHRIGLVPLKNQKSAGSLTLKTKGGEVLSGLLGKGVAYQDIPLVLLGKDQEIELVARTKQGIGKDHSKFSPGLFYYRYLPKIEISPEGEKHSELAELYPRVFEFNGKLKVLDEKACSLDNEDLSGFEGVNIKETGEIAIFIESWGQLEAGEIFAESVKVLKDNLNELSKSLK